MMQHDDKIKLQHMLDHAKEAVALVRGKEKSDLQKNRLLGVFISQDLKF